MIEIIIICIFCFFVFLGISKFFKRNSSKSITKSSKNALTGVARSIEMREAQKLGPFATGGQREETLIFRLEKTDENGNVTSQVSVEMVGKKILGKVLREGDKVQVFGKKNSYGIINPKRINNLTTDSIIQNKGSGFFGKLFSILTFFAFFGVVAGILIGVGGSPIGFVILGISFLIIVINWILYFLQQ